MLGNWWQSCDDNFNNVNTFTWRNFCSNVKKSQDIMWTVVCGNYPVGNCLRGIYPRWEFSEAIVLGLIILGTMIQGDYHRSFFIIYHYFSLLFYYFRFCNGKWLIRSKTEKVLKKFMYTYFVVFRGLHIRLNVIGEVKSLHKYFKQVFL